MATVNPQSEKSVKSVKRNIWHYQGAVVLSPLFDWPLKPWQAFLALTKRWVTITRNVLFLSFALCVHHFFTPPLEEMQTLTLQWVVPVFLRNLSLMVIIAGGLHAYLFIWRGQGRKLKFDPRMNMEKNTNFIFGNQLHDNIFRSIVSGVMVWSVYEVLYYWGSANGVIPTLQFSSHSIAFVVWLLVLPVLLSSHFYFIHRWLHWPPLYKRVHRQHHFNIHIGPWSGMAMHPIEHIFYISSVLIHFVVASHPVIFLVHLYTRCLAPAFSHAGFEKLLFGDKKIIEAADFHHQLHHRFFECNYGNVDAPWDRWFGSLHDGSDDANERIKTRRRQMYKKAG